MALSFSFNVKELWAPRHPHHLSLGLRDINFSRASKLTHTLFSFWYSYRRDLKKIWVVAGVIQVLVKRSSRDDNIQQWRQIVKIYSQRFYRFPAYNLAVLVRLKNINRFLFNTFSKLMFKEHMPLFRLIPNGHH